MGHAQAGCLQSYARFVEIGDHLELRGRAHTPESLYLDRMEWIIHRVHYPTSDFCSSDGLAGGRENSMTPSSMRPKRSVKMSSA